MPMHTEQVTFLGVKFDNLTLDEVSHWLSRVTCSTPYTYVVTPNVDHHYGRGDLSN